MSSSQYLLRTFRRWFLSTPLLCVVALGFVSIGCSRQPSIRVVVPQSSPLLDRAAKQLAARLQQAGYNAEISSGSAANAGLTNAIILSVAADAAETSAEAFEITPIHSNGYLLVRVTGTDTRAVFWGGLEAADQIAATRDLEAVRPQRGRPFLKIRAAQVALPAAATAVDRNVWQAYFDLLARNRFNSVFFQARQNISQFTCRSEPGAPATGPRAGACGSDRARTETEFDSGSATPADGPEQRGATIAWLRELFRTAREHGLNPYLGLEREALAAWVATARPAAEPPQPMAAAPTASPTAPTTAVPPEGGKLRQLLPSILQTYPDLAGVAFSSQALGTSAPVEKRSAWVIENILSPLAELSEHRAIFLGVGDWLPEQGSLGPVDPNQPVYLVAPYQKLDQLNRAYAVLWELHSAGDELLPWQDPAAIQQTIRRLGDKRAAGFLCPEPHESQAGAQAPDNSQNWFRAALWGRIGYSPDAATDHWEQEFGSHFGNGAGILAYNAAVHANQVLSLLRSYEDTGGLAGTDARNSDPSDMEQSLFQPPLGTGRADLIADALSQQGLLLQLPAQQKISSSSSPVTTALQRESEVLARTLEQATRRGAWKPGENAFQQKLDAVSQLGLALGDYLSGVQLLARFAVSGGEESRQGAMRLFDQAQIRMRTDTAKLVSSGEASTALTSRITGAIEFSKRARPWQWEKVTWDVGVKDNWQPTAPGETPLPTEWKSVKISRLAEFGLYGKQRWVTTINQQLRTAFFTPGSEVAPSGGSLLVARKTITAKTGDRLAVRIVSDETPMVWVNHRRAFKVAPQQLPWSSSATVAPPMQAELFSATLQEGNNELLIAASAKTTWPSLSASFISASEKRETIALGTPQARLSGALAAFPVSDIAPQSYVALSEPDPTAPAAPELAPASSAATYKFKSRAAGFYRMRLWLNWRNGSKPDLTIRLDGTVLKRGVGRGDSAYQKWHWTPIEATAGLGPGEHVLTITGWTRGAWVSGVEIYSAW